MCALRRIRSGKGSLWQPTTGVDEAMISIAQCRMEERERLKKASADHVVVGQQSREGYFFYA